MVSLRGRELRLLALRGRLLVDGREDDHVALEPGLTVELVAGVGLTVRTVVVPDEVPGLEVTGQPPRELCAGRYSLLPTGELVPRYADDGLLHAWSAGDEWHLQVAGHSITTWKRGLSCSVGRFSVRCVPVSVSLVSAPGTVALELPLTLVVRHTTVHVLRSRHEPAVIDGIPGRIVSEAALLNAPAPWHVVAGEVWPHLSDPFQLRTLWDRSTRRLRARLREIGVRDTLVRADGRGNVELFLFPGDQVRDEA